MAVIRDVMPAFELVQPNSITDAQKVLEQQGENGWVLAGGMDSFDWLKDRIKKPRVVVDLSGIAEVAASAPATGPASVPGRRSRSPRGRRRPVDAQGCRRR